MRIRYFGVPICLVLTFVVASRLRWPGSVGDIPQALAQQRTMWDAHKPPQYILSVSHTSATAPTWFTLSSVAGGAVKNVLCRRYDRSGMVSECAVTNALYPLTAEQVFEAVETAYRSKYQGVEVQYDANYGYPASVRFDPQKEKIGDEWGYEAELGETKDGS
jgi:hypothetical protein